MTLSRLESFLWEQSDHRECDLRQAEQIVLALRRRLRELEPDMPIEYDGNAWASFEKDYIR